MKPKLKLNVGAIKALAVQHGEKAALGLGVFLLLMFIWSAIKMDVLGPEKQPEKLEEAATKTDNHITDSKWDPIAKGIEVVDYVQRAKRDPLVDRDYRLIHPLNPALWDQKGKRPDPKMLTVEELQATAGLGVFAFTKEVTEIEPRGPKPNKKPPAPGPAPPGKAKGGPLAGAKPKAGAPEPGPVAPPPRGRKTRPDEYAQPRGVRPSRDSELKGLSWVVITGLVPFAKQEAQFEDDFRNVIKPIPEADEPQYTGMKIERTEIVAGAEPKWDELKLVAYHNQFRKRWQSEMSEVAEYAYTDRNFTMPLAPLVGADWDPAAVGHPKVPFVQKGNQGMPEKTRDEGAAADEEDEGFGFAPREGHLADAPPPKVSRKRNSAGAGPARQVADYILFRFIDTTVEPGRKYQYRVRLQLANPNFEVTDRYLKNPESKNQRNVFSPWSEPTPVVTTPRDVEVFAGPVVKASPKDPIMRAMVTKLDRPLGLKLVADETFRRGNLITIQKKIETEEPAAVGTPITVEARLNADAVVVDIEGGKPLKGPKSPTMPGEMVILQADGSLVLRDEMDDESTYRANFPEETSAKPGAESILGLPPGGAKDPAEAPAPVKKKRKKKPAA